MLGRVAGFGRSWSWREPWTTESPDHHPGRAHTRAGSRTGVATPPRDPMSGPMISGNGTSASSGSRCPVLAITAPDPGSTIAGCVGLDAGKVANSRALQRVPRNLPARMLREPPVRVPGRSSTLEATRSDAGGPSLVLPMEPDDVVGPFITGLRPMSPAPRPTPSRPAPASGTGGELLRSTTARPGRPCRGTASSSGPSRTSARATPASRIDAPPFRWMIGR
jgi:hypothetical protein